ncbi:MAG: AMIN-like domain-containing (lipo)protein [Nocardioidaceae bacterium]
MKTWLKWIAVAATVAAVALVAPSAAQAAPYCGITWGSLDKSAGTLSPDPLIDVRAGRHTCFDRLVMDFGGSAAGYTVRYVSSVYEQGTGEVIPLRGGAFLDIALLAPAYDAQGNSTYNPANPSELVDVAGWQTFRQASYGGSFEGYTTIGLGVRARLPFRVFTLNGPGNGSRLVIDVAHRW